MAALGEEVGDAYITVHADSKEFRRDMQKLRVVVNKMFDDLGVDSGDAYEKGLTKGTKRADTKFLGRLKGSRNDALNTIGSIGGALESLVSKTITGGFKIAGDALGKIGGALMNTGEGFGGLQGPMIAVGSALVRVGAGMSAASATGIGLVVVLGVLIASFAAVGTAAALLATALSMLTGIVVALTASLAYAAAGALLPLGPMALAAAAGVGALVVAFKDLTDEQKAAFGPLKKTFKDVQKVVRDNLFRNLGNQISGINDILKESVAPLLIGAAGALSTVFDYMIAAFQRPEVKATLDTLSQTLPGILEKMGGAFTDLSVGLLGFFAAIAPQVGDVATKIGLAAARFAEWAASAEGQQSIKDFFDKAWSSAQTLWGVIEEVGKALGILFANGKTDGDGMIAKIGEIIAKFTTWAEDSDNRDKIKQWFSDAKDTAEKLWGAVEQVGVMIDKLDTEENRAALLTLIGWIESALSVVNSLAELFKDLPGLIEDATAIAFTIPGLGATLRVLQSVVDAIRWISNNGDTSRHLVDNRGSGGGSGGPLVQKAGGILNSPTRILAGEAGREMIVPLVRPLNQVDPSVRAVSAFARGLDNSTFNGGAPAGKVVNIHPGAVQVTAASDNVPQVANAVLDRLVARWK